MGKVSVDALVLDFLERSRAGKPYGILEYIEKLDSLTGGQSQAQALYDSMGAKVALPPDGLGEFGLKLVREGAPIWELVSDEF